MRPHHRVRRRLASHGRDDSGSAPVELVLAAVMLIPVTLVILYGARASALDLRVESAAAAAARAASLQSSPVAASAAATSAAEANIEDAGLNCASHHVEVTTANLHPGGSVTATVSCVVPISDLVPGAPVGSYRSSATVTEVVDTYRGEGR
jgi:Flp pilus assembly protein TadG